MTNQVLLLWVLERGALFTWSLLRKKDFIATIEVCFNVFLMNIFPYKEVIAGIYGLSMFIAKCLYYSYDHKRGWVHFDTTNIWEHNLHVRGSSVIALDYHCNQLLGRPETMDDRCQEMM